jgi:BON domain
MSLSMEERKEGEELRREPAKDYYAGYYWGNNPYTSTDSLSGRKSDGELRNDIIERLKDNSKINSSEIQISVTDSVATLNGSVATYEERRLVAEEVWNVAGVVKVLNELRVTDPETAGPSRTSHH